MLVVDNPLFSFDEPTSNTLTRIRKCLVELSPVNEVELQKFLRNKTQEVGEVGGFDEVFLKLSKALRADYEENLSEVAEAPWTFDYVVEHDGYKAMGLSVLTRLRSTDPTQGNILYGSQIYRLHDGRFIYWIEDTAQAP